MATMKPRASLIFPQLIFSLCLIVHTAERACGQGVRDAIRFGGSLVCLDQNGKLLAWRVATGEPEPILSAALSKESFTRIASNGNQIWGVIGDLPLLIFRSQVLSPTLRRSFVVPQLEGRLGPGELRVRAVMTTDRCLWIGTGQGEWGGHLLGLNIRTGRWVKFSDSLHYVTGIARGPHDIPIVSWSMSHFGENTLIRIHKNDSSVATSYPELSNKYYHALTYDFSAKKLYGFERDSIVSISEGKPTPVARAEFEIFKREPRAIGVSSSIIAIFAIAPETLLIVPNRLPPRMLRGKRWVSWGSGRSGSE